MRHAMASEQFRSRIVRLVLAALLLAAAILKARQLLGDSTAILPGLLHDPILIALLIQSEFLLALWLLVGGFARLRFIVAVACFSIFAIVSGYEAMHALASCGCFGNVKIPPAATAGLDVAAVVALCVTRARHSSWRPDWPSRRRLFAGVSAAVVVSGALWTLYFTKAANARAAGTDTLDLQVLDPQSWLNKPFPLFDEIDGPAPLRAGKWMVVLYHYDCVDCLKAIPDYRALAAGQSSFRLAFVAMPPFAPVGREPVADSADYLHLRFKTDHEWFATTPVAVTLQDGRVLTAAEGEAAVRPPDWR